MKNLFFLLLIGSVAIAQNGKEKILVTDLAKIKTVTAISANGQKAIFALQSLESNDTDKLDFDYRTHLWLTDFQTPPKALTRGLVGGTQPALSPDGKLLAFTRATKTGKPQIFILPLDGGEAYQLTDAKYGASSAQWQPDGSRIAFSTFMNLSELLKDSVFNPKKTVPLWSIEKPGFKDNAFLNPDPKIKADPNGSIEQIRAYLEQDVADKKAKVINRLDFQGEATTNPEIGFNHLMLTADLNPMTKATPLTSGFVSHGFGCWSADGKKILIGHDKDVEHPDREQETVISELTISDLSLKKIVGGEKDWAYNNPELSADGRWLAYTGTQVNWLGFSKLFLANADGTGAVQIDFDRACNNFKFSADGKYLYLTAQSNGGSPLYRLDVKTKKVERLTDFESGITNFDLLTDRVIFAKTEVANPSELYWADLQAKNAQKITNNNTEWLATKALSFPEKRTHKNSKGQTVEFWIMKPTNAEAGKKYPLLLNIHGGPTAMWGPGEASMWHEHQYFCSQGYGVVYANPRGSGGYGKDFQFANYQDWGAGPQEDVLKAATEAAKEAWADTSRQIITGGSYAGYLTAWIIAHDHRFKAAFAQRGVYDLRTFMGEGNAWRLTPNYFGYPWDEKAKPILERESPINYVQSIRTPFLIKHGENDLRTGVIQSEMLYKSLKILGKEVEYVRMPGGTHELSRSGNPRQRIDRLLRIYEFFERYVGKR